MSRGPVRVVAGCALMVLAGLVGFFALAIVLGAATDMDVGTRSTPWDAIVALFVVAPALFALGLRIALRSGR